MRWVGDFSLGYNINESVGLLLVRGYSVHKTDHTRYAENIKADAGTMTNDPTYGFNMSTGKWEVVKLMAGGFYVTPITESSKLALLTKLTAGVCKTSIPWYTYSETASGIEFQSSSRERVFLPWTFCYQVSVGLKYKLKDKLYLLFDLSSFNATPSNEEYVIDPTSTNAQPVWVQKTVKHKLAELNTLVGIGFDF